MTTAKTYDYLNRLTAISSSAGASNISSFSYQYNNANQRTKATPVDGSYWVYSYDSLGQVTGGNKYWSDGTPVAGQQFDYTFDTIGNRTQTQAGGDQTGANLRTANYTNNGLNQITSRSAPGDVDIMGLGFATNAVTVNGQAAYRKGEYFRDQVGVTNTSAAIWQNVTVASPGQGSVAGNLFVPKTPEQFSYDADGNLLQDGRWTYVWDGENRLINMTSLTNAPSGSKLKLDFAYDYMGRRIQKIVSTNNGLAYIGQSTNLYLYDGWNLVVELGASGSLVRSYLWGSDLSGSLQGAGGVGGLLGMSYYGSSTTNCFVAYDGNGNVSALVNAANGGPLGFYEYGPFGEVIRATGPMAKGNPLRFSTKYADDESDMLYYGYRYYCPSTGRWLSRDPISEKGGPNVYCFVQNGPENAVDLLGLCDDGVCGKDVTSAVNKVLDAVNATFDGWNNSDQERECKHLISPSEGAETSWDIQEMWQLGRKSLEGCERQATFQGRCYYGSAINYALFGRAMCKCHQAFHKPIYSLGSAIGGVLYHKWGLGDLGKDEAMQAIEFTRYGYKYGSSGDNVGWINFTCAPDSQVDDRTFHWKWQPLKQF
ncbi:MAG TPA: RHS repeat-associated core domain-containing protein [Candidatus Saccharimonadales bacterium]|nr:RHS repeat-associated core domain-containing protein [Candidatus Saccharimonadales bacterium]